MVSFRTGPKIDLFSRHEVVKLKKVDSFVIQNEMGMLRAKIIWFVHVFRIFPSIVQNVVIRRNIILVETFFFITI